MPNQKDTISGQYNGQDSLMNPVANSATGNSFSDGGPKDDSFMIQPPTINLPKGGGALRNIDEKFLVNAINGTAAFSVPLPFSKTRNEFAPVISLNYNSGSGNGEFGAGWHLDQSFIQRVTDKQLPAYEDSTESDVFMLSGGEDLVPVLIKNGSGDWIADDFISADNEKIKTYRPRIEGSFNRIERVTPPGASSFYWKVTTKKNYVTIYGRSSEARISDPSDPAKIFKWLPELCYDDRGNCFEFDYLSEDLTNVAPVLHEANRLNGNAPVTNTYLKRIRYGNKIPYFPDPDHPYNPAAPAGPSYFFEAVLDYGDHDEMIPSASPSQDWPCRIEPFSNYKPGFEIRCYRLCRRLLFFHYFKELNDGINVSEYLVRSLDLVYRIANNPSATADDTRNAEMDYIISIMQTGYLKNTAGGYDKKSYPPLEFSYQDATWDQAVYAVSQENTINAPAGIFSSYQWIDLWNEGIPGILTEETTAWYYKSNLDGGNFSRATAVMPKPSVSGLAGSSLLVQDLEGDGRKFVVKMEGSTKGYFELYDDENWAAFQSFYSFPNINLHDPNVKFLDVNGDGKTDIVISEENVFTWYESKGVLGFGDAKKTLKTYDEEKGSFVVFRDPLETIFLADMSGDGLTDIVRIRNGEVCYWPNCGFGKFGAKVNMTNAPFFDLPDIYNSGYIQIADINGTGAGDLIYLGKGSCLIWLNLAGNGWSEAISIDSLPSTIFPDKVMVTDFLGNGTSCLVWSSPLANNASMPLRYIDLMGGKKPFVMTGYKNNFGKEVSWNYKSSTWYYLQDKIQETPWVTRLPFPVQCVSQVLITDQVTHATFTSIYSYHHGYYDHPEKEFRGFGRVDQADTDSFDNYVLSGNAVIDEALYQQPVLTKSWFHTGAYIQENKILDQYAHEYFQNADFNEYQLPQPVLPTGLTAKEIREALRSCKNTLLRQEVYGADQTPLAPIPYSATEHNCNIRLIQPRANNPYAVFLVTESEAITYHYERNSTDPRIAHTFNIETDELGNVLQAATVSYPRQTVPAGLPGTLVATQQKLLISYQVSGFTNDVITPGTYRLRMPCFTQGYELAGAIPAKSYFALQELGGAFNSAALIGFEIPFENSLQKKPVHEQRTLYLAPDVTTPLPLGQMATLGLVYESYRKKFTAGLLTSIYSQKAALTALIPFLAEGGYVRSNDYKAGGLFPVTDADDEWWAPSGRVNYPVNPGAQFFMPASITDPFSNITSIQYYADYFLLAEQVTDPIGSIHSVIAFDWRFLQPLQIKDLNNNLSEARYDMLGMLAGIAIEGKGTEADDFVNFDPDLSAAQITAFFDDPVANAPNLPGEATTRFVYNLSSFPAVVATIKRETHYQQSQASGVPSKLQLSFDYSDGLGKVAMQKKQTTPGIARKLDSSNNVVEVDTGPALRWVGTGRKVVNNKGNTVMQYEPYFSVTWNYEDETVITGIGVTPVLYYDPPGRLIKVALPDGSFTKTTFDAWQQTVYDGNDTVTDSDWYAARMTGSLSGNIAEHQAAVKAAVHYNTPAVTYLDTPGRQFFTSIHNRYTDHTTNAVVDEFYNAQTILDIEGNQLSLIDARGNVVISYANDLAGQRCYLKTMDAGERWLLNDCGGRALYSWDSRSHQLHTLYDSLRRPLQVLLSNNSQPFNVVEQISYGEGQAGDTTLNLRGKIFQHRDQAGLVTQLQYDFKGNSLKSTRVFTSDYQDEIHWDNNPVMNTEIFTAESLFDALNRPVKVTTPYNNSAVANIMFPVYDEAGALGSLTGNLRGSAASTSFIVHVDYNEKGQRVHIQYGNSTVTNYEYDPMTFLVRRIITTRNSGADILQDLRYTYDPVGNITYILDNALDTIFFNNKKVEPSCDYTYDATYRLTEALGREQIAQNLTPDAYDAFRMNSPQPGDGNQMQTYRQQFTYDSAGNMTLMNNTGSWSAAFTFNKSNNQLLSAAPNNPPASPYTYQYDAHGNLIGTPHLSLMEWDFKDELKHIVIAPSTANDQSQQSWYCYDAMAIRARKVVLKNNVREERLYLGGIEIFRRYRNNALELERETLQVTDEKQRICMVDTPTLLPAGNGETQLLRYQYSNHLGTACLELDANATIISYEEYYPFGSTSYQANDTTREIASKRYRYTGKERDEESGFYYHGLRYFAPWLARWTAPDPSLVADGLNLYSYVSNNPVKLHDETGKQGVPDPKKKNKPSHPGKAASQGTAQKTNPPGTKTADPAPPAKKADEAAAPPDSTATTKHTPSAEDFRKVEEALARLSLIGEPPPHDEKKDKPAEQETDKKLDVSVQVNPLDSSIDSTGATTNRASTEIQVTESVKDEAIHTFSGPGLDSAHDKVPIVPNEIAIGHEFAVGVDFKVHFDKDDQGHRVDPLSILFQLNLVDLTWKRKNDDFLEFSVPSQLSVGTDGSIKYQVGAELDLHLSDSVALFGAASFGGSLLDMSTQQSAAFDSYSAGGGVKFTIPLTKRPKKD